MSRKLVILILLLTGTLALSLASMVAPTLIRARNTSASNACVNNLRLIDSAKQQWALENRKTTNDAVTLDDIRPYVGDGVAGELPRCPFGGIYTPGRVGESPTCSIGGLDHSLDYDFSKDARFATIAASVSLMSFLGLLVALFLPRKTKGQKSAT